MTDNSNKKKNKIIDTTIQVIALEGLNYASAGNISKEGDFNKSIIFYYFENIEDLLLQSLIKSIDEISPILKSDFENYKDIEEYLNKSIHKLISDKESIMHLKVILSFIHQTMYFKDFSRKIDNIIIDDLYISLRKAILHYKSKAMDFDEIETLASLIMTIFNGLGVILLIDGSNDKFIRNWELGVKLISNYIK